MSTANSATSLKDLLGSLAPESGADSGLLGELAGMLQNKDGLQGLIQQFKESGWGDLIASWVGKGENKSISPEQIKSALGSDKLQAMAAQLGLSPELLSGKLSQILPQIVDKLTPDGEVPAGGLLEQGLSMFRQALK